MLSSVNLKYYHHEPNIGDRLSLAVAQYYFSPNVVPHGDTELNVPNIVLVGSILQFADAYSYVCGAGYISNEPEYLLRIAPQSVNCVRGPMTGYLLDQQGLSHPHLYADPGILAPFIYPQSVRSCSRTIGLIPHYVDFDSAWVQRCRIKGLKIINPFSPPESFFAELNACEAILSSSLHGIIFAHAYGKPALWIELSDNVIGKGFKFYDYYLSLFKKICGFQPVPVMHQDCDTRPIPAF